MYSRGVSEQLPADEGAAECEERLVGWVVALEADEEPAVAVQPGEGALGDPPVPAELLAGVDLRAGDPRPDAAAPERPAVLARGVGLVGVEFLWAATRAARRSVGLFEWRDGVDQALEDGALVHVRGRREGRQRRAAALRDQVVVAPRLAPVGRVRPRPGAPLF